MVVVRRIVPSDTVIHHLNLINKTVHVIIRMRTLFFSNVNKGYPSMVVVRFIVPSDTIIHHLNLINKTHMIALIIRIITLPYLGYASNLSFTAFVVDRVV